MNQAKLTVDMLPLRVFETSSVRHIYTVSRHMWRVANGLDYADLYNTKSLRVTEACTFSGHALNSKLPFWLVGRKRKIGTDLWHWRRVLHVFPWLPGTIWLYGDLQCAVRWYIKIRKKFCCFASFKLTLSAIFLQGSLHNYGHIIFLKR